MDTPPYGPDVRAQHRVEAGTDRTWRALLALTRWWPPRGEDGERLIFEPDLGGTPRGSSRRCCGGAGACGSATTRPTPMPSADSGPCSSRGSSRPATVIGRPRAGTERMTFFAIAAEPAAAPGRTEGHVDATSS